MDQDERITALKKAIRRRRNRDWEYMLRTGAPPPIRKQRTRWFNEALETRTGDKERYQDLGDDCDFRIAPTVEILRAIQRGS